MTRLVAFAVALLAGCWAGATALADGEAGLVIEYAEGQTDTYCIAFEGDSVTGEELIELAGLPVNQFSGVVCAIGDTGCTHSGSFDSCTCECKAGSGDCTYWSYFTQPYGESWRYSVLGFQSAKARDGDLQAWRWGEGSAASAPPPAATTFEAVCGHAPGSEQATALPATIVPPATAAVRPSPAATATNPPGATGTDAVTPAPTTRATPAATGASATAPAVGATPQPPFAGDPSDGGASSGGGSTGLIGFGIAAGIMIAAIAAAAAWRQRRGS